MSAATLASASSEDSVRREPESSSAAEVRDLAPVARLVNDAPNPVLAAATVEPKAGESKRIGRFTVLGTLGAGGMGTVLRAYDDTLARMVALKLLHKRYATRRQKRLLREAQALAQLSHPNVVQVYEMGVVEEQMFIAMELVRGQTLRTWQRERRPWREVLDVYLQAGRGLAAAHLQGIIHRDFKPENCMIGDDGRVCVLDFGLARGRKPSEGESASRDGIASVDLSDAGAPLEGALTRNGAVLGTLWYLPLQQLSGDPANTKSDQYSFCVSLYEALYGSRPFADASLTELLGSLGRNELLPTPRTATVPARLRKALLRGLALDPDDRWPSMDALLAELERLRQPRRWGLVVASLTFVLGMGGLLWPEDPCQRPEAGLDGTWGPTDREAVRTAFTNNDHYAAPRMLQSVETRLNEYTDDWVKMAEQSCRATFVDRQQSEALFDRRMLCLQRRHNRLRTAIDSVASATTAQELVDRTILPFKLPPLALCADVDALGTRQLPPIDPAARSRVAELRARIDRANTLYEAADVARGLALAEAIVTEARSVSYLPVLAEALECLGHIQSNGASPEDAKITLEEAIEVSARAKADEVTARAWAQLIHVLRLQGNFDEGLALERTVKAAVTRAGDEVARGWMLNNLGTLHGDRGEFEQSHRYLRRALAVKQHALGENHVDVGIAWFNLGNTLRLHGSVHEAMDAFGRARSIFEITVSDSHPYMAFVAAGLGHALHSLGHASEAAQQHRHALKIREATLGPDHFMTVRSLRYLGEAELDDGQLADARLHLERALAKSHAQPGSERVEPGRVLAALARLELAQEHLEMALPHAQRALAIIDREGNRYPEERAQAQFALARSLWAQPGERPRARMLATQARDAHATGDSAKESFLAEIDTWLAEHRGPAPTRDHQPHDDGRE